MAAQDGNELFDVIDRDGVPLGARKARHLVHRDGDWHRSLHVWVLLESEPDSAAPWVLFQRRSDEKDTWPGAIDVAVTGHYRAGEDLAAALREAEEEIGLPLSIADVARLGLRRVCDEQPPPIVDRELQDVLLATTRRGLASLRPDPDEVAALVAVPLDAAVRLARAEAQGARGLARGSSDAGSVAIAPIEVRLTDFVGAADGYYALALESILRLRAGERGAPWTLG